MITWKRGERFLRYWIFPILLLEETFIGIVTFNKIPYYFFYIDIICSSEYRFVSEILIFALVNRVNLYSYYAVEKSKEIGEQL